MRKRKNEAAARVLSFILSLVMVLGMVDTTAIAAFAAGPEGVSVSEAEDISAEDYEAEDVSVDAYEAEQEDVLADDVAEQEEAPIEAGRGGDESDVYDVMEVMEDDDETDPFAMETAEGEDVIVVTYENGSGKEVIKADTWKEVCEEIDKLASAEDYEFMVETKGAASLAVDCMPKNAGAIKFSGCTVNIVKGFSKVSYPITVGSSIIIDAPVTLDYLDAYELKINDALTVRELKNQNWIYFDYSGSLTLDIYDGEGITLSPGFGMYADTGILTVSENFDVEKVSQANYYFDLEWDGNDDGTKTLFLREKEGYLTGAFDLEWDGYVPTWTIADSIPSNAWIRVCLRYRDGNSERTVVPKRINIDDQVRTYRFEDASHYFNETGDYAFTVQIMSRSREVHSRMLHYEKPGAAMDAADAKWSKDKPGVIVFDEVQGADGYTVCLYKLDQNYLGADYVSYIKGEYAITKDISSTDIKDGKGEADFSSDITSGEYYTARVCTWSDDIKVKANGFGDFAEIYPEPETPKYDVIFVYDGYDGQGKETVQVMEGGKVKKPAVKEEVLGGRFEYWYYYDSENEEKRWDFDADTVTEDITLYAKWMEIPVCTVTLSMNGHGAQVKSISVNAGSRIRESQLAFDTEDIVGYAFGGWYGNQACTGNAWDFDTDTVQSSITLYAKWAPVETVTVSFNMNGHGTQVATVSVNKDSTVKEPAKPAAEGFVFGGWYKEAACTNAWKFRGSVSADTVSMNSTLYAKWTEEEKCKVSFDLQGHGEAVEDVSVAPGQKVSKPADPSAEGYIFGGWYKEKACTTEWSFASDTVSSNVTLYAKWTEKLYDVTFDMQGHGEQVATISVNAGSEVAEPAKPSAEGFLFGGWFREKACTTEWKFKGSVSADTVSANVTLYAKWTEEKKEDPVNTETTVTPEDKDDTTYAADIRKDLKTEGAAIGDIKAKTYDGKPYLPTVKVTASVGGKTVTLTEGADYRVLYKNNVNAGTGTVIVKGNGLYTGEITKDFTISKKPIGKLKVVAGGLSVNSTAAAPVYVYDGGTLLKAGVDYDVTKPDTSAKGAPKVTITAKAGSNYEGSRTAAIKVYDSAKVLGADDIKLKNPADASLAYTGKALKPEVEVKFNGTPLDKKEYSVKYTNNKEAGTAFITVTGKKGYAGSAVLTFTIRPVAKAFDGAAPKDATYSGKAQKPKMKVTVDGKTLKAGKDYVLLYSDNVHAGKGKVTVKGLGNYAGTASKTFEFTIKPQSIKKASVKGSRNQLEVSYAKKRLVEGTDYTAAYGAENKGKVEVTLTGKGDFAGTATKKVKAK